MFEKYEDVAVKKLKKIQNYVKNTVRSSFYTIMHLQAQFIFINSF